MTATKDGNHDDTPAESKAANNNMRQVTRDNCPESRKPKQRIFGILYDSQMNPTMTFSMNFNLIFLI